MKFRAYKKITLSLIILFVFLSCEEGLWDITVDRESPYDIENLDSYIPVEISNLVVEAGFVTVSVTWDEPIDVVSYDSCQVWYGIDGDTSTQFTGTIDPAGTVLSDLINGEIYTILIKTVDVAGNISTGISFDVVTVAGTLPEGLGLEDLEFREDSVAGDGISDDEHVGYNRVYLSVNVAGHTGIDDFSLYYRINGFHDDWQKLSGGNALIDNIPDGPYTLDVEYLHDDELSFQTSNVTEKPFNINVEAPGNPTGIKAFAGYEAIGVRWDMPDDWDYDQMEINISPAHAATVNVVDENYCEIAGLTNETDYTVQVQVQDDRGQLSGIVESATVTPDDFFVFEDMAGVADKADYLMGMAKAVDNKVYVVGKSYTGDFCDAILMAFTENLVPDLSFGDDGLVTLDWAYSTTFETAAVDSQDRIIVTGYYNWENGASWPNPDLLVGRYLSDGSLDMTFGTNGFYTNTAILGGNSYSRDEGYAILVDSDDSLYIGGSCTYGNTYSYDNFIVRLSDSGQLDASFGSNGRYFESDHTVIDGTTQYGDSLYSLLKYGDAVFLAGSTGPSNDYDVYCLKLDLAGNYYSGYATNDNVPILSSLVGGGVNADDFVGSNSMIEVGGSIYLGGNAETSSGGERDAYIVSIDPSDGTYSVINTFGSSEGTDSVTSLLWDGTRIYIIGNRITASATWDLYIQSIDTSGATDASVFSSTGIFQLDSRGVDETDAVNQAVLLGSKIICTGRVGAGGDSADGALWVIEP